MKITDEFLNTLKELCLDYDGTYGRYPESEYEGWEVYLHALGFITHESTEHTEDNYVKALMGNTKQ